ncbi:MAG TPA: hypothetical protein VK975_06720 [Acidimicrobiales bacterium]|nr:hypothetical protein [Acidimicrobiales bacterium]
MTPSELDELVERLGRIAGELDPPPVEVLDAAQAAFAWRTVDTELAELTYDSCLEQRPLAGVRQAGGPRQLTFEAPGLIVEVEMVDGDGGRMVGQLVPPGPGVVEVRHPEGSVTVAADRLGRFTVEPLPSGPVSLRCRPDGAQAVDTDWVTGC